MWTMFFYGSMVMFLCNQVADAGAKRMSLGFKQTWHNHWLWIAVDLLFIVTFVIMAIQDAGIG